MNVEYLRTQFILQPDGTLINKVNRSSSAREGEVAGTLHLLGNFSTLEEARAAYETAKRTYHPEAYTNE